MHAVTAGRALTCTKTDLPALTAFCDRWLASCARNSGAAGEEVAA